MRIIAIETSCDETSAAIIENGVNLVANTTASSQNIQAKYGGIVPEVAARKQAEFMYPVLQETFQKARIDPKNAAKYIDAIAVTIGPGLMGSLLVGVETAKTLSYVWQKPLIPVNHLIGHLYSAWLDETKQTKPKFPLIGLVASGGHTELVLMKSHHNISLIGSTLDDAVGEAFDKVARILGLGYPGGPAIENIAKKGNSAAYKFPRPLIDRNDYNFSYSGLKTSVLYKTQDLNLTEQTKADISASFQQAAFDVLVEKTFRAVKNYQAQAILITGGVAANQYLRTMFFAKQKTVSPTLPIFAPPLKLATDNASYIGAAASFQNKKTWISPTDNLSTLLETKPNPNLRITDK